MKNWDRKKRKYIKTDDSIIKFLEDIDKVCKKHGYSISHEDGHGSFEINEYDESNIEWLKAATLNIN